MRFDALHDLRAKYPKELYEWNWNNVYDRPDLQAKGIILMMRDNYNAFRPYAASDMDAYAFADAAYNGGSKDLSLERRACKISSNCDPAKWFGHVENYCVKGNIPLYGQRTACMINREHVTNVLKVRADKYIKYF